MLLPKNRREHFSWKVHDKPAQTGAGTGTGRKGNGLAERGCVVPLQTLLGVTSKPQVQFHSILHIHPRHYKVP